MNILNKFESRLTTSRYFNRDICLALTIMLMLGCPAGGDANETATAPPVPATVSAAAGNETTSTPGKITSPAQTMRFVTLGSVTFTFNGWELSDAAKRTLDNVSAYLMSNPNIERLLIDGHTDSVGGVKFNDTLSDKRAMAVLSYLTSKGVDPTVIHWRGYGERAPIDENWNRLGRGRNRHVELYAIYLPK